MVELNFHCFYFIFFSSWFIELYFNFYRLLLFIRFIICQVLLFGVLDIIFASFIVDLFVRIDHISVCWSWNLSSCVLENCPWDVSKPDIQICFPFKFFVQYFLCLLLTCVYHIHWVEVHWSWNLSSGELENCQWAVSKPDVRVCFPRRFVEGRGEGASFCDFICRHQCIDCIQGSSSSYSILKFCRWVFPKGAPRGAKGHQVPLDKFLIKNLCCILRFFVLLLCLWGVFCFHSRTKGHKGPLVSSLAIFLCFGIISFVTFLCLWIIVCFYNRPKGY